MEVKKLVCINCPMGCSLEVKTDGGKYLVSGNLCKNGIGYALSEATNPARTVTTSLFVDGGTHPTVSVKSSREIPKALIRDCMKELAGIKVKAPVKIGEVIVNNILNTSVDIVATRNIEKSFKTNTNEH
jgi:CxxC motif-containing protein